MSNIKGITNFLTKQFPDEETAIRYFAEKRWGDSPCCPKCKSHNVYVQSNLINVVLADYDIQ